MSNKLDDVKLSFCKKPYKEQKLSNKKLKNIAKRLRKRGHHNIADCVEQYPEGVFYKQIGLLRCLHVYVTSPHEVWKHLAGREGDLYLTCRMFMQVDFRCTAIN